MTETHLYGNWERPENPAELNEDAEIVIAFLNGQDILFTPEMQMNVRREFKAQEDYRLKIQNTMNALLSRLQSMGAEHIAEMEKPRAPHETYQQGRNDGEYSRTTEIAQMLSQALIDCAVEIG